MDRNPGGGGGGTRSPVQALDSQDPAPAVSGWLKSAAGGYGLRDSNCPLKAAGPPRSTSAEACAVPGAPVSTSHRVGGVDNRVAALLILLEARR